ncbi:MAG: hypothetical protein HY938_11170 [Nitrosomonadales bacterium]|nr:hypothetical protein [Nitrosomonadales bacterium]
MLNLIVSTIVFFIASWYLKKYLDEQEIPKGMTRGVLIFTIAALVSWGAGALVDWVQGPQAQTAGDLSQMLKSVGQAQP